MELKKSKKASLEDKRLIFGLVGLLLSISIVYIIMEAKFYEAQKVDLTTELDWDEFADIPMIQYRIKEKVKVKPKTVKKKTKVITQSTTIKAVKQVTEPAEIEVTDERKEDPTPETTNDTGENTGEGAVSEPFVPSFYTTVEEMPTLKGCNKKKWSKSKKDECTKRKINSLIGRNLMLPDDLVNSGFKGRAIIHFIVDENGEVTDIEVVRSNHDYLSKASIKAVSRLPQFTPGKQNDKAVRVKYAVPIKISSSAG